MIILNEELYAKNLILGKNTELTSPMKKIGYISRYNFHVLKKNDKENYDSVVSWMSLHQKNFEESSYSNAISRAIQYAKKHPFYVVEGVNITKNELQTVKSLDDIRKEKILFVLLCMAKFQMLAFGYTDGLVKYNITELCKMARVSISADEREYILHDILVKGLISCPKKNDTNCLFINFIEENGENEFCLSEIDYQELAYRYLKWKNKSGFRRCITCGRLFLSKYPSKKCKICNETDEIDYIWCVDCGKEVKVNQHATETCRCEECKKKHEKILKSEQNKRAYINRKLKSVAR